MAMMVPPNGQAQTHREVCTSHATREKRATCTKNATFTRVVCSALLGGAVVLHTAHELLPIASVTVEPHAAHGHITLQIGPQRFLDTRPAAVPS